MGEMVEVTIEVTEEIAKQMQEKGFVELVTRLKNARIKEMPKCYVKSLKDQGESISGKLFEDAFDLNKQNRTDLKLVRKVINSLGKDMKNLTDTAMNMSIQVEEIFSVSNTIKNLSYLNTGLSLANMAVDAAGFVIVTEKLNMLNEEVQQIAISINQVANIQKNEKLGICQKLIMRCNAAGAKIKHGDELNLDGLEILLIDMKAYLSEMIWNMQDEALGTPLVLKIIFTLLPAYTSLFHEFVRRYYFLKSQKPANYEMFLSLYHELYHENYFEKLQDYYFLEEKLHQEDVTDILNAHTLIGINGRVQIEDQTKILETLKTKEKVLVFEGEIEKMVRKQFNQQIPKLG